MSSLNNQDVGDGMDDALAAVAVVLILVAGIIYWLTTV